MFELELDAPGRGGDVDTLFLFVGQDEGASEGIQAAFAFSPSRVSDHLAPDRVAFPGDVFALVDFELAFGG